MSPTVAVYVFGGWHPCPERDVHFGQGWTEWELLKAAAPHFDGHVPPPLPASGIYDDSRPEIHRSRLEACGTFGIDVLVHGAFWSRGKKVFEASLDDGLLPALDTHPGKTRFAVMWANRMPHRVLPMRVVDPLAPMGHRKVYTDSDDLAALIDDWGARYFSRADYWKLGGVPYWSIYDTSLFVRQTGLREAERAIARVKARTGGLHVAAIDPEPRLRPHLRDLGFDSVTHYVKLPDWKGPRIQNYAERATVVESEWPTMTAETGLPYYPSVATGWDATPRATLYDKIRPDRFPWSPIIVGNSPEAFGRHAAKAAHWTTSTHGPDAPMFVAAMNEWTEGYWLEPDVRDGDARLRALRDAVGR